MSGQLFMVPTPIGNLEDISFRAVRTLKEADIILAEDTRTTSKLLNHYEITTNMKSFHMHNEHKMLGQIISWLETGMTIAQVSDAGTPGISDPGFLLVRACVEKNINVISLPGATAFVPALVNSGLPSDKFVFEGFLPVKKGRQTRLKFLVEESRTIIFYESPHKLLRTLKDLSEHFGSERKASVSREISKMFEETKRGTLQELFQYFTEKTPKGEFVLIVDGIVK